MRRNKMLRGFGVLTALAVVATAGLTGAERSAGAFVANGCKFPGATPEIQYRYVAMDVPIDAPYRFFHSSGKDKWNAPSVPGYFINTTGSDPEIDIFAAYYSWTDRATATRGCGSGGNWNNNLVTIRYNLNVMDNRTDNANIRTATHELGHAYGLAYDGSVGCLDTNPKAVMFDDSSWVANNCPGIDTVPYPDDIEGVQSVY